MWHDDKYFFHLEASKREIVQIVPAIKNWLLLLKNRIWNQNLCPIIDSRTVCVQVLYEVAAALKRTENVPRWQIASCLPMHLSSEMYF